MEPVDDYPLRADEPPPEPLPERRSRWLPLAAVLIVAVAVAVFIFIRNGSKAPTPVADTSASPSATENAPPAASPAPRTALGRNPADVDVPALGLTDPVVRLLLKGLSSHPELATWLATDNLLRHGVAAVENVAAGRTPANHFRSVAPQGSFRVRPGGEEGMTIDPQSYARYNALAETISSLDAAGISTAYATLRPRMMEAYAELGHPDDNFDAVVERAIVQLLRTPVPPDGTTVAPGPVMFKYVDPQLENLSAAQKQLLRMGPANARLVQRKLREIALALGIPDQALPPI
jgi:hypothetical protein